MINSPLSPRRLKARARAMAAVEMRIEGKTFDQIAEALGLGDRSAARKSVERGMQLLDATTSIAILRGRRAGEASEQGN